MHAGTSTQLPGGLAPFLSYRRRHFPSNPNRTYTFACFRLISAPSSVFRDIIGSSLAAARTSAPPSGNPSSPVTCAATAAPLRVWEICPDHGPSGTAKELAARSIAESAMPRLMSSASPSRTMLESFFPSISPPCLHAGRVRVVRSSPRFIHRRHRRPQNWLEHVRIRLRVSGRTRRSRPRNQVKLRVIRARTFHRQRHLRL